MLISHDFGRSNALRLQNFAPSEHLEETNLLRIIQNLRIGTKLAITSALQVLLIAAMRSRCPKTAIDSGSRSANSSIRCASPDRKARGRAGYCPVTTSAQLPDLHLQVSSFAQIVNIGMQP